MLPIEHFHPMLVHFPIALILLLTALDLVGLFGGKAVTGRSEWGTACTIVAVCAGISAVAAFMLGDIALEIAEAGDWHSEVAETHEALGTVTAVVLGAWGALRGLAWILNRPASGLSRKAAPAIDLAATALVFVTAYFGGQLVYVLGVSVAHS